MNRHYGAHAETSLEAPATTWYLAEGATHGNFDLFYLLLNATGAEATATITYGVPFAAGHGGAGITAPATAWFLAEGATGNFFDMYVLIANPGQFPATVDITYLLPSGQYTQKFIEVPAQSRKTISVDDQAPVLANTPVSMIVRSINDQPIIVERAMWWPSPNWYEAHLSAGATSFGSRWALADGEIGSTAGEVRETYILIANTGGSDGSATVTLLVEGGDPIVTEVPLKAQSRTNVPVSGLFPAGTNAKFGALVESSGPIVVERAMYTSAGGVTWTAGTAALATKLQ